MMHKICRWAVIAVLVAITPTVATAHGDTLANYRNAQSFLDGNLHHEMYIANIDPHWIGQTARFWYLKSGPAGKRFILVNAAQNTQGAAFDQARLAASLSRVMHNTFVATTLPFESFKFINGGHAIEFDADNKRWVCTLDGYDCKQAREATHSQYVSLSPNGHWATFVRNHNLYVRNVTTGAISQLTHDGRPGDDYATPLPDLHTLVSQGVPNSDDVKAVPAVFWSPDSTRLMTYRLDSRKAGRFNSIQYVPPHQLRPIAYNYVYSLPGEVLPEAMPLVFELAPTFHRVDVETTPLQVRYYGGPGFSWTGGWLPNSRRFYYIYHGRGLKYIELREVDAVTGKQTVLHRENAKPYPYVDPGETMFRFVDHDKKFLWTSERNGWNQLYLYDAATGELIRQLMDGNWVVRRIVSVDNKNRQVFFLAGGVQKGMDPYYTQLYRVSLNGGHPELLTPEDANHQVDVSPNEKYFVDNYSRPDLPSISVLRRTDDGSTVRILERTDDSWLVKQGWTPPIAFVGKAADDQTDLYGLIVRPTNFDRTKKYPVVECIYTGPHGFFVPKTFFGNTCFNGNLQAMAELGFVVVMVDGRGTIGRSRAFHDFSYRNLGNVFVDHVTMIKQMAAKYPWMDIQRVGIYGASAGGYGSTHAFLQFPDFYKVCVSTSGDHDPRLDKATWNEKYQGYPVAKDYVEQANQSMVDKLKGHMLLIHGDIDDNVNPAETMRLVDALMTANKPFDMLLVPNMYHGDTGPHALYVTVRRWNYFVRYLLGATPPRDFRIYEAPAPTQN